MKQKLRIGLITGALVYGLVQVGTVAISTSGASAAVCFKGGQAYGKAGVAAKQSKAKARGRKHWRNYAIKLMGTTRVGWDWAKYRGYHCKKKGLLWYCNAIATPCV